MWTHEMIKSGINLNEPKDLETQVMGNEGQVINSEKERDYSHISDPIVLALLYLSPV